MNIMHVSTDSSGEMKIKVSKRATDTLKAACEIVHQLSRVTSGKTLENCISAEGAIVEIATALRLFPALQEEPAKK